MCAKKEKNIEILLGRGSNLYLLPFDLVLQADAGAADSLESSQIGSDRSQRCAKLLLKSFQVVYLPSDGDNARPFSQEPLCDGKSNAARRARNDG